MLETEKRNPKSTHLDTMDTLSALHLINDENRRSVEAVEDAIPEIARAVDAVAKAFAEGGRLIYVGAGTSGRLASQDAAECPPTFGVDYGQVIAINAGGERTLTHAAENIEDQTAAGRNDLLEKIPTPRDVVMGISASGGAAYVASALLAAKEHGCVTVSLASNRPSKIGDIADIAIFTDTGAEVLTGSTRMKAGNAQKMVMNMITTVAMAKTGHVYENMMIMLKPTNKKLRERMIGIVGEICGTDHATSETYLTACGFDLRRVLETYGKKENQ